MKIYALRGVFQNPCSRMGRKLKPELPLPRSSKQKVKHAYYESFSLKKLIIHSILAYCQIQFGVYMHVCITSDNADA